METNAKFLSFKVFSNLEMNNPARGWKLIGSNEHINKSINNLEMNNPARGWKLY